MTQVLQCPKCGYTSGDTWGQCDNECPMIMSPYYCPKRPNQVCETQTVCKDGCCYHDLAPWTNVVDYNY